MNVTGRFTMAPPKGTALVFLFDDISMASKDKWGHISQNELLRQWLCYQGWYQTKSSAFRKVKDINIVATVSLRNEKELVDERLGWNFCTIGHFNSAGGHIEHIYSSILKAYFTNVPDKRLQLLAPGMILKASLGLMDLLNFQLMPSPTNFLQQINYRHLLFILRGLVDAPPTNFSDAEELAVMWLHEASRTVLDRFPDSGQ